MRVRAKNLAVWTAWIIFWGVMLVVSLVFPVVLVTSVATLAFLGCMAFLSDSETVDRRAKRMVESLEQDLRRSDK